MALLIERELKGLVWMVNKVNVMYGILTHIHVSKPLCLLLGNQHFSWLPASVGQANELPESVGSDQVPSSYKV